MIPPVDSILEKIPKPSEGWTFSMDRTNWKYGKRHINILKKLLIMKPQEIWKRWGIEHLHLRLLTGNGTEFPVAPIGFYFAKLWYWEKLHPMVWTVHSLEVTNA